jgi:glutathione S-transferase
MMKLYVIPGAPNSRKAQAVVLHLDLPVETVSLDLRAGDTKRPEYLALNPNGYTPTLVHGERVLWESSAVMQYLCEQRPGNTLFPADAGARADIARWQFWEQANLMRHAGGMFRENFVKPTYLGGTPDPQRIAELTPPFHRFAAILDLHLQDRAYVVGNCLTLADFSLAANFCYATLARLPWDNYPAIQAWYARIDAEPAWHATAPLRAA